MSTPPFLVPAGLVLRRDGGGLHIEYEGDIELQAPLGEPLRSVVSTGGDVILGLALELDLVHAAGSLRSSHGLRLRELIASDARVQGDLAVESARVDGALTVDGDLKAGDLRAHAVQTHACDVEGVEVAGLLEAAGDVRLGRGRLGALRSGGDLHGGRLEVEGAVAALGEVEIDELQAAELSSGGDARLGRARVAGDLSIGGGLVGDSLDAGGRLSTGAALSAGSVTADSLAVGGAMSVKDSLVTRGALEIGGDVSIAELQAGSLVLGGKVVARRLAATGELRTRGAVQADRMEADQVLVEGGRVDVKVLVGRSLVQLGAVAIKADIVMAPTVRIDPAATGKISVVESQTEFGPSKVKGCLSLEDLDDLFGNAEQFLAERGVSRLGAPLAAVAEPPAEAPVPEAPVEEPPAEAPVEEPPVEEPPAEEPPAEAPPAEAPPAEEPPAEVQVDIEDESGLSSQADVEPAAAPAGDNGKDDLFGWADQMLTEVVAQDAIHHPDAEASAGAGMGQVHVSTTQVRVSEPVDLELEAELEPVEPVVEQPVDDPIHAQMHETISRIVTCYAHTEMPPAVTRLKELVEARDYTRIRADITEIWNQLLKFHQKRGMRIQPQVTTTFNTINALVRKL